MHVLLKISNFLKHILQKPGRSSCLINTMDSKSVCWMCICSTCTHFASVRQFSAACFSLMKYAKLSSVIAIHQSGLRDFVFHDPNQRDSLLNRGTTLTLFSLAAQFVVGKGRLVDYREKNTSVMLCILSSYINMRLAICQVSPDLRSNS